MFFDWSVPLENLPILLRSVLESVWITLVVFTLALIIGTILALIRLNKKNRVFYYIATTYVEIMRNTPVLVQIFFIYFGLPQFGIRLNPIVAGILALTINNSAYICEILRSGIQAVSRGQREAANSIALSEFSIFVFVILPQALRNIFPSLINQFIMTLFGTSLLTALDVKELSQVSSILASRTARTMEIFIVATIIYYGVSTLLSAILRFINKKYFPSMGERG